MTAECEFAKSALRVRSILPFLRLHELWEWQRSGHRLPNGSLKGGAIATSACCFFTSPTRTVLRYRKMPGDRRRIGQSRGARWTNRRFARRARHGRHQRRSRSPQGESAGRGGRIKRWSPLTLRLTQSGGTTSRISDRIVGLRQNRHGLRPSLISAMAAASFSMRPIRSLRRSGRCPRERTDPTPPQKNPCGFKAETKREREPVPSGGDFPTSSRAKGDSSENIVDSPGQIQRFLTAMALNAPPISPLTPSDSGPSAGREPKG